MDIGTYQYLLKIKNISYICDMSQFSKHIEDLGLIRDRFTYLEDQGYNFDYLYWIPWTKDKFHCLC